MKSPRIAFALAATGIAGTAAAFIATPNAGAADVEHRYELVAQGDSMVFGVNNPSIPASPNNEAGSLTTHAELNSNGNSKAFAGAPYFGKTVQTLPGTANGIPGGFGLAALQIPFTTLPGYVESRYPSAKDVQEDGQYYRVHAKSEEGASSAEADNGAPAAIPAPNRQQQSKASVGIAPNGTATSEAFGNAAGLVVGPLEIANSSAVAKIVDVGDGAAPHFEGRSFGRFSVSGQEFGFDQNGFRYLGQSLSQADALTTANMSLKNAGLRLDIAPLERTVEDGSVAYTIAGLRLTTYQSPTDQDPNQTITYTLGRAKITSVNVPLGAPVASVNSAKASSTKASSAKAPSAKTSSAKSLGRTAAASPAAAEPAATLGTPVTVPAAEPVTVPVTEPAAVPVTEPAAVSAAVSSAELPRTLGLLRTASASPTGDSNVLFGVLVLGGAGILAAQQLIGRFGVRLARRR